MLDPEAILKSTWHQPTGCGHEHIWQITSVCYKPSICDIFPSTWNNLQILSATFLKTWVRYSVPTHALFVPGFRLGLLLDPEDGGGAFLRNVFSPIYTALQPYPKQCELKPTRSRHSSLARKLWSWVRNPLKAAMSVCIYSVCVALCR
jgi:hypothetical protein